MTDANVSQVLGDGSTAPLTPEANDDGVRVVQGFDQSRGAEAQAEDALQSRLEEIFDKHNPDGGIENTRDVKPTHRAPNGQFAKAGDEASQGADDQSKATGEADEAAKAAAAAEEGKNGDKPNEGKDGQTPATVPLPRSWSPADKKLWDSLPPDAQAKFADRERQASQTISRQGQMIAAYRPIGELLVQSKDVFERHGAPPVQGLKALLDVQRALDTNPAAAIAGIIKTYAKAAPLPAILTELGIKVPRRDANGNVIPDDPRDQTINDLRTKVQQLSRHLQGRDQTEIAAKAEHEARARAQYQAEEQAIDGEIGSWSEGKTFFAQVAGDMAHYVRTGAANDLDEAYEMACNANPEIRRILAEEKAAGEAKKAEEAKAKAAKDAADKRVADARRAGRIQIDGSQQSTRRPNAGGKDPFADDYLGKLYDRVNAGA